MRPADGLPLPCHSQGVDNVGRESYCCHCSEGSKPPTRWRGGGNAVKTASAAKIAARFNDYLEASREQPVLITRNGKPVAVLLAVHDKAEAEQLAVGRSRSLRSIFEEAHEQLDKGGGIPHDKF